GGAYRHNVEDYEGIVRDIGWITAASFVMVLVIIAAAFRTPRALLIIFVPLMLANLWTLGVAGATVGSLNTFTSFVNAVLIGLGVEFGVHLFARYRELRKHGHHVEDSVIRAWDLVGSACTSAAFTSAAGFAALIAAHFAGFRQLGWLLSLGLLFCLVAELVCMPLLLAWLDREPTEEAHHRHRGKHRRRRPSSYRLAPMALTVIGCVTLVSALLIPRIEFEFDLSELRRSGLAYEDLTENEKLLARESYAPLIVSYPSIEELDANSERIKQRMAEGRFPEIATVLSIRTVIPRDQAEKIALLEEIVGFGKEPNAAYLPAQVRENIARVANVPLVPVTPADLPVAVRHVLGANGEQHRLLLLPSGNMWDMREAAALAEAVERELPGQEVAGEYLTLGVLYELMQRDAPIIGGIAFGLVVLFTLLDLRSLRATAGAIAVLVAGVAWWGALLVSSGIKISIVNFVGIPIVLGIGIDVMIHLIHRLKQEGPGRIQKTLSTTGWASALGTSTTVVAFAALSLASSQGIRSLGLLVLLGEMAVTVAGFVLVPLGFATAWRLQGRHPTATHEDTNPGV
ncbi:MAG: MMPL family transporter, partial [Myxococcota bacterium]